jgi:transposase
VSLHPRSDLAIPEETWRVAHAAFPKGALGLRIADELGPLYRDDQFAELFPTRGQPAASPARLALASVLQYVEGLSDRQAADAVRGRIDWKYALGLELTDPGFDHTVLSELARFPQTWGCYPKLMRARFPSSERVFLAGLLAAHSSDLIAPQ